MREEYLKICENCGNEVCKMDCNFGNLEYKKIKMHWKGIKETECPKCGCKTVDVKH